MSRPVWSGHHALGATCAVAPRTTMRLLHSCSDAPQADPILRLIPSRNLGVGGEAKYHSRRLDTRTTLVGSNRARWLHAG